MALAAWLSAIRQDSWPAASAVAGIEPGFWAVRQRQPSVRDFGDRKYGIWKRVRARMLFNDPRRDDGLRRI
ncbi:MAG: hypothetical protein KF914_05820 [Rhizobiaceae bacterium]|nr:hypothetical protein [Rhizobiaceae bacterium]